MVLCGNVAGFIFLCARMWTGFFSGYGRALTPMKRK